MSVTKITNIINTRILTVTFGKVNCFFAMFSRLEEIKKPTEVGLVIKLTNLIKSSELKNSCLGSVYR